MAISEKQYAAGSALAYVNFEYNVDGKKLDLVDVEEQYGMTLSALNSTKRYAKLSDERSEQVKKIDEKGVFQSVGDWKLINYQNKNDKSGFCASAYETTDGHVVFAFRGTEPKVTDHTGKLAEDFKPDLMIGLSQDFSEKLPKQFEDAKAFMKATLAKKYELNPQMSDKELKQCVTDKGVTSTGHSLGGGLSEYFI